MKVADLYGDVSRITGLAMSLESSKRQPAFPTLHVAGQLPGRVFWRILILAATALGVAALVVLWIDSKSVEQKLSLGQILCGAFMSTYAGECLKLPP